MEVKEKMEILEKAQNGIILSFRNEELVVTGDLSLAGHVWRVGRSNPKNRMRLGKTHPRSQYRVWDPGHIDRWWTRLMSRIQKVRSSSPTDQVQRVGGSDPTDCKKHSKTHPSDRWRAKNIGLTY